MAVNTYSNHSKDSFLPGKHSGLGHQGADLSAKNQNKAPTEKKLSNKIEVTLAQVKQYCRTHGLKISEAYNKTFSNARADLSRTSPTTILSGLNRSVARNKLT